MSELIDISPPIHGGTAVFPGDTAFKRTVDMSLETTPADNLTLSHIETTLHIGAHTDAPNHYVKGGASIDERPLQRYYGPCQVMTPVVDRESRAGLRLYPRHLPQAISAPRLLLHTKTFPDADHWNDDFLGLSAELVDHLAGHGVSLIGIDTPSVDPAKDQQLESHHAIARHDMAILEGIVLDRVSDGLYQLIALPLRIVGGDASPVRAVLVTP